MKFFTTIALSLIVSLAGFAQQIRYDLSGSYARPIKKDQLIQANTLSDIRSSYPSSWVTNYTSVEVETTTNGVTQAVSGINNVLNEKQKQLLSSVEIGTDIIFRIAHDYKNPVTQVPEPRTIQFSYTVLPETEASFSGGQEQLDAYLSDNAINKIPADMADNFGRAVIAFVIDEKGGVENATIASSSGDRKVDKLLLRAIRKMPVWKPALDASGRKVKQSFQFTVGYPDC